MEKKIFACVNGHEPSETVCDYARWFGDKTNITIQLIHTLERSESAILDQTSDLAGNLGLGETDELLEELVSIEHDAKKLMLRRGKIVLEKSKRYIQSKGQLNIEKTLLHGPLQSNLLELVDEIELLVIGRKDQSQLERKNKRLGHNAEGAVRALEVPILIVEKPFRDIDKVMLAFDGSENSQKAVSFLSNQKRFHSCDLYLVHVGEMNQSLRDKWDKAKNDLQGECKNLHALEIQGNIVDGLIKVQKEKQVDFTVMGAFGQHWLKSYIIGSTTSEMINRSNGALLLVR